MSGFKQIGIVGGMGPRATVRFFDLILKLFQVNQRSLRNGEYPQIHVRSINSVENVRPGDSVDPRRALMSAVDDLRLMGAEIIAVPCNTAQAFLLPDDMHLAAALLFPSTATCQRVMQLPQRQVMLLATRRTIHARLHEKLLAPQGYEVATPPEHIQILVDDLVDRISGDRETSMPLFGIGTFVASLPAQTQLVLGCTELSFVAHSFISALRTHDSLNILAEATYEQVISGKHVAERRGG